MSVPILICDDSGFARKQLACSLPKSWDVEVSFAADGAEALAAIMDGKADILFLDLNMPVMDGYQVLEAVRSRDLPTLVVVVSGDVQPQARQRVMALGALDFIKKPIDSDKLLTILDQYGVLHELDGRSAAATAAAAHQLQSAPQELTFDIQEGYQEIANVGMGQAADLLARLLRVFIELPIPQVRKLSTEQLPLLILQAVPASEVSVVTQGFVGAGISGEALLFIEDSHLEALTRLIQEQGEINAGGQLDLLMEISNILIGACMGGFAEQLDLKFSMGHPVMLDRALDSNGLAFKSAGANAELMTIEMCFGIREQPINCTLLLMFTGDSLPLLDERINLLVE
ncbi:MAG: CheY-like chemotaxis protein [Motiliproteus sp.]|jgi:CheY-like chemotaxis protein